MKIYKLQNTKEFPFPSRLIVKVILASFMRASAEQVTSTGRSVSGAHPSSRKPLASGAEGLRAKFWTVGTLWHAHGSDPVPAGKRRPRFSVGPAVP